MKKTLFTIVLSITVALIVGPLATATTPEAQKAIDTALKNSQNLQTVRGIQNTTVFSGKKKKLMVANEFIVQMPKFSATANFLTGRRIFCRIETFPTGVSPKKTPSRANLTVRPCVFAYILTFFVILHYCARTVHAHLISKPVPTFGSFRFSDVGIS